MLKKLEKIFDTFGKVIGNLTSVVLVLMIANVFYDVVMRYFFNSGSIAMQEMEWHLFSVVILLGMAYTMQQDGHVRVDLFYDRMNAKKKAIVNLVGVIIFVLPVAIIIGYGSIDYVMEAYQSHEGSGDPGGLSNRWLVKSLIPLSFLFLVISALGSLVKQISSIKHENSIKHEQGENT